MNFENDPTLSHPIAHSHLTSGHLLQSSSRSTPNGQSVGVTSGGHFKHISLGCIQTETPFFITWPSGQTCPVVNSFSKKERIIKEKKELVCLGRGWLTQLIAKHQERNNCALSNGLTD